MPKIIYKGTTYASSLNEVPNGGTTGQVLAKASNTDKDIVWKNDEREWKEIARYTGTVTSTPVSVSIPPHKYLKLVFNNTQASAETSQQVLRAFFNGIYTDSSYDRQGYRYTTGGTLTNIASGTTQGVIIGVSQSFGWQSYTEAIGTGIGGGHMGWNRFMTRLVSDSTEWTNATGWYRLRSVYTISSMNLRADASATYNVEAIVYGHN